MYKRQEKKQDKSDARITRLYPTDKAKKAPDNIKKRMDELETTISRSLTKNESEVLSDMLDKAICSILERSED